MIFFSREGEKKIWKGVVAERFAEKPLSTRIEKAVGTRPRGTDKEWSVNRQAQRKTRPGLLLSSSSFPERFSLLESMLLPAFNTVEKIFSVSDDHFPTQRLPPPLPFFLNVDSFQSFSLFVLDREKARERERFHAMNGGREGGRGTLIIITLQERRIEEFVIRFGNRVGLLLVEFSMQPFEGRVHHGGNASETAAAAMQLRVQRKIVRGRMHFCSFPPFFFFFSPPPIISILTQSSIVTDIVTNYLSSSCPRDRGAVPPPKSLIEDSEKKRERDIYIILRF